jgi:putative hydrolase of the HAD superfamily
LTSGSRTPRAVFLDAGLTLIYPDPPPERVYAEAFAASGLDAQEDEVRRALHATWREVNERQARGEERWGGAGGEVGFWRLFVAGMYARLGGGDLPPEVLAGLVAHFGEDESWRVYDDVFPTLAALREKGVRLVVVSNWDSTLPGLLERLALASSFDAVLVSAVFGASKPSPRVFHEALRLAGVEAEEAIHVGDSFDDDVVGARAAGIRAFLLDRKGGNRGAGSRSGSGARDEVETLQSLSELLALFP